MKTGQQMKSLLRLITFFSFKYYVLQIDLLSKLHRYNTNVDVQEPKKNAEMFKMPHHGIVKIIHLFQQNSDKISKYINS